MSDKMDELLQGFYEFKRSMEKRMDSLEGRIAGVEDKVNGLEDRIDSLAELMKTRFDKVVERLKNSANG